MSNLFTHDSQSCLMLFSLPSFFLNTSPPKLHTAPLTVNVLNKYSHFLSPGVFMKCHTLSLMSRQRYLLRGTIQLRVKKKKNLPTFVAKNLKCIYGFLLALIRMCMLIPAGQRSLQFFLV